MDITTAPTQITPEQPAPTPEHAARVARAYHAFADWLEQHPAAAYELCRLSDGRIGSHFVLSESRWSALCTDIGSFRKDLDTTFARAVIDLPDGFSFQFFTDRSAVCELVDTGEVEEVEVEVEVEPAVTRTEKQTRPVLEYRCGSWLDNEAEQ